MKSLSPILHILLVFTSSALLSLSLSFSTFGTVALASTVAAEPETVVAEEETIANETTETEDTDVEAEEEETETLTESEADKIAEEIVEEIVGDVNEEEEVIDLDEEKEESNTETAEETVTETTEEEEEKEVESDTAEEEQTKEEEVVDSATTEEEKTEEEVGEEEQVKQTGPFIDLLGETLLSLEMIDDSHAQMRAHLTNDVLKGKKVIGLYFSADWCGPCRQFTPELVSFYEKMNSRRGKENQFEIVWISRCRDYNAFGQYFTHMSWLAMQPELALGEGGQKLSDKYKVKGIPTLVLLDEDGNVITTDGRNKIPADRAGIGFPWRNPLVSVYLTVFPRPLRLLIKSSIVDMKRKVLLTVKGALGMKATA